MQSPCMASSSSVATSWNCYNAFGYRLFNHIFVSYCKTTQICIYKGYMQGYARVIQTKANRGGCCWLTHDASLVIIMVTLVFVTCLIVPVLLTHIVLMFFIYIWMAFIYIGVCSYLIFSGLMTDDRIKEWREKYHSEKFPEVGIFYGQPAWPACTF